jgi:hypothetical protein
MLGIVCRIVFYIMKSCFGFIRTYSGYDLIKPTDVELGEMIPNDSLLYGVTSCKYQNIELDMRSPYIRFWDDGIQLPDNSKIKYEYIANFCERSSMLLSLNTFTDYSEDYGIHKSDRISCVFIFFDDTDFIPKFKRMFLQKVLKYRIKNSFDKSVFKMESFKKIFRYNK